MTTCLLTIQPTCPPERLHAIVDRVTNHLWPATGPTIFNRASIMVDIAGWLIEARGYGRAIGIRFHVIGDAYRVERAAQ